MQIHNSFIGFMLAILGTAIIWHVSGYPEVAGQTYGPSLFPNIIGFILIILGSLLVIRHFRQKARWTLWLSISDYSLVPRAISAFLYILTSVLLIVFLSNPIGMQLIVFLVLLCGLSVGMRTITKPLLLSIGLTIIFDLTFRVLLRVPLPSGILSGLI